VLARALSPVAHRFSPLQVQTSLRCHGSWATLQPTALVENRITGVE
jgi:hypothetical protein